MTAPIGPGGSGGRTRPKMDVAQLWAGGVATAIVAGLVALVDLVIGIVIGSLVSGIAKRSTRVRQPGEDTESYTRTEPQPGHMTSQNRQPWSRPLGAGE